MLKPINTNVFSKFTPIKDFAKLAGKTKPKPVFFRFDSPTGFTQDQLIKTHSVKQLKAEIPEIYY